MSGIVGIWNLDGQSVSGALLTSLSVPLAHRGPDGNGQWIKGPVGLACQMLRVTPESAAESQPAVHPSGRALVFDGRLDNRDELLTHVKDMPGITAQSPDSAFVLAIYEIYGEQFVKHLAGDFALALYDQNQRMLLLARDALGIRPLYHTRVGSSFLFASEIKALLAHPHLSARPNDDMLACYLLSSRPKDTSMTCFQGISSLLPAHIATMTPERFSTRRYWDFEVTEQRCDAFQDYAQAFRHHFAQAVRRRLRSAHPVVVSVSGGLDSSSILCMVETLHRTYPEKVPSSIGLSYLSPEGSPSDEKEFLVEIERMYDLSIQRIPSGRHGLMGGGREAVWHIEAPFLDQQWNTLHTFFQTAHRLGARTILTGHWADQVLFPQAYLVDLFRRLAWGEIKKHLTEFNRWLIDMDPHFFRQQFWLDLVKYHVPGRLVPTLRRVRATPQAPACYTDSIRRRARRHVPQQPLLGTHLPTAHARSLYEEVRSSYHVRCMEWDNKVAAMHGCDMAFPFLDRDLLTFLMSIPGEIQTWNGVPKGLLREALRGILPDSIADRRWKADFSHLVNQGMEHDYPRLVDSLASESAAVKWGYLDGDATQALLQESGRPLQRHTCEAAWALSDLLGLELWLQVFFEKKDKQKEIP